MASNINTELKQTAAAADIVQPLDRLLRLKEVTHVTGLGRNTIYRFMYLGMFPMAVSLGGGRVGWRQSQVRLWIDSRPQNTQVRVKRDTVPWSRNA